MLKKSFLICLFFTLSGLKSNAFGAMKAEKLMKYCESTSFMYCTGYIAGFYDGRTAGDYGQKNLMTCPPFNKDTLYLEVSYEQMRLVFLNWAKKYPEKLHYDDWQALREAFAEAWPCK